MKKPNWLLSFLVLPLWATFALGADFPQRNISLVVPFDPGGGVDTTSRIIAEAANGLLDGREIFVVNRSGGGGIVGQTFVSRAAPDGYTILAMTSSVVTNPDLKGASYSIEDFKPVALYNLDPEVIAVSSSSPFVDIDGLIAAAKNGKLNMVTAGVATSHHMAGLAIEQHTDVKFNYLPIKGFGNQLQAVMGKHAHGGFWPLGEAATHALGGSIRLLAIAADERDTRFPDVPTFSESGLKIPMWATFRGWAVPAGTPDDVVAALSDLLARVSESPVYQNNMKAAGYSPVYRNAQAFETVIDDYVELAGAVIDAHGLGQ